VRPERCADASAAAGESLAATAVTVEWWLLVELRATWPRDVADALDDDSPSSLTLRRWVEETPASRLLFVRRPGRTSGTAAVFVVRGAADEVDVRRFELDELAELEDLDLESGGEQVDASLTLVCGHGSRDACCALRGNAVFSALAEHVPPDELWVSSHQGGHRFAANVLVLPAGIQLGRLTPENAPTLVADARAGTIALGNFRGRTAYPPRVQAADIAVRDATGLRQLHDLALVSDDGERVRLAGADGRLFDVEVEEVAGPAVPASCGAAPEPQTSFSAQLV
jgi:hypothetical protein